MDTTAGAPQAFVPPTTSAQSGPPTPSAPPVSPPPPPPPGRGTPDPFAAPPPRPTTDGGLTAHVSRFWAGRLLPLPTSTLVIGAAVGVAAGGLLITYRAGLGVALVWAAVWAAALPALIRRRAVTDVASVALVVALFAVPAISDAGWVVAAALVTGVALGSVVATAGRSTPAMLTGWLTWLLAMLRATVWTGRGIRSRLGTRARSTWATVRTTVITLGLVSVFVVLFASADAVFASLLPRFDLARLPAQTLVGVSVALVTITIAHLAIAPPAWAGTLLRAPRPVGLGEWLVPVLALDAVVLTFIGVQVSALLGGHQHVLSTTGLTYAQYARAGFGQLVAVTALTLVVVGVAARRAPRRTGRERLLTRVALAVLCLATLGVVASALRRMGLYLDAYGLTRLRLFVVVVEVVLAVVLVLVLVAGIRWSGRWLPRAVASVVGVAILGVALVNSDAMILRHNTTADLEVDLDVSYLRGLSADAAVAADQLTEPLRGCVLASVAPTPARSWPEWNLRRHQAEQVIAGADLDPTACARVRHSDG